MTHRELRQVYRAMMNDVPVRLVVEHGVRGRPHEVVEKTVELPTNVPWVEVWAERGTPPGRPRGGLRVDGE